MEIGPFSAREDIQSSAAAAAAAASAKGGATPSLVDLALEVLQEGDPWNKAALTAKAADLWRSGAVAEIIRDASAAAARVPARPARADDQVKVVGAMQVPKLGRAGSLASRQALIHNLVHIENWAVDLAWDVIARWGSDPTLASFLPREFFSDFVAVAEDEARHFTLLEERLKESGSYYGAIPVHDGLWDSASATAHSLPARLAVEHCCHEARGLDVLPTTISKFRAAGDEKTAALLSDVVYAEEISHCAAGVRWLRHLHAEAHKLLQQQQQPQPQPQQQQQLQQQQHQQQQQAEAVQLSEGLDNVWLSEQQPEQQQQQQQHQCDEQQHVSHTAAAAASCLPEWAREPASFPTPEAWFHALVLRHYGSLKGPFNDEARLRAGFTAEWYVPLVPKKAQQAGGAAAGKVVQAEGEGEVKATGAARSGEAAGKATADGVDAGA